MSGAGGCFLAGDWRDPAEKDCALAARDSLNWTASTFRAAIGDD